MAQISVSNLTFCYEGKIDNIFEEVSFSIDTDWRLGFIGRNGKGKTTFLNLLMGKYEYQGTISASAAFDYFPYPVEGAAGKEYSAELMEGWKKDCELWRVLREMEELQISAETLYRPYETLSHGERTKVMLAVLFSGENDFLLIDEPTNHLDQESRELVKRYLSGKKGFILVSHDRDLLDACVDHVLVLNRCSIEVQSGNFSSWWENKNRKDAFSRMENEKHLREIGQLKKAAERSRNWAAHNEAAKIGFDPIKEHDRSKDTRAFIGAKTKKMQSRVKQYEQRMEKEIQAREGLLADIEAPEDLKIMPLRHYKEVLVRASDFGLCYERRPDSLCCGEGPGEKTERRRKQVLEHLNLELRQGERVFLHGPNGCGKSSLIKAILRHQKGEGSQEQGSPIAEALREQGALWVAPSLAISYVNQDTSFLRGSIREYCERNSLEESLFCAVLRQLDLERAQFSKNMEDYSEGQKKKVLIAASLLTPAHLYIWDEPLNYIDVFSRMQIEKLILAYRPTMLVVDHDVRFREKIATRVVDLS